MKKISIIFYIGISILCIKFIHNNSLVHIMNNKKRIDIIRIDCICPKSTKEMIEERLYQCKRDVKRSKFIR